ncbi:MAG: biotin transporter BioY [Proteobacteria bacterium]|nr:biotin transporter BioY [Pseudomonadota bacterium]MCL2308421.1 biotin transporter BioY [Pseudomonadota bacterium]
MSTTATFPTTLLHAAFPTVYSGVRAHPLRAVALTVLGSLALAVSAKIQFPFGAVPFTMQTYVVLVLGALLGKRLACASVLLYLAQGLAGLPVFAIGGGLAYLASPTFGYLVGFLPAAMLVGHFTERGFGRTPASCLLLMAAAHATLFAFGVFWLAMVLGLKQAYWVGLHPFWLMSIVKTVLAAVTVALAWKALTPSSRRS